MPQLLQCTLLSKCIFLHATLEKPGFELHGSTYTLTLIFFNQYTSHPSLFLGFTSVDSSNHEWKIVFLICVCRETTVCIILPIRNLSSSGFWYLQGLLEPAPHRKQWTAEVKFWGNHKLHVIFDCTGLGAPNTLHHSRVNCSYLPNTITRHDTKT